MDATWRHAGKSITHKTYRHVQIRCVIAIVWILTNSFSSLYSTPQLYSVTSRVLGQDPSCCCVIAHIGTHSNQAILLMSLPAWDCTEKSGFPSYIYFNSFSPFFPWSWSTFPVMHFFLRKFLRGIHKFIFCLNLSIVLSNEFHREIYGIYEIKVCVCICNKILSSKYAWHAVNICHWVKHAHVWVLHSFIM